jgi:hypothetical protein
MAGKHWRDSMHERNKDWTQSKDMGKINPNAGKGSRSRVSDVDAYKANWDKIFNKEDKNNDD